MPSFRPVAPPLLRDLPRPARALLFRRLRASGIRVRRTFTAPPWGGPFFSLSGCWFRRGTLHWEATRTDVDTFAHEACHAIQLSPAERRTWDCREIPTSEDLTMPLQVELLRGIPGLGIGRALAYMQDVGYSFDCDDQVENAMHWWRKHARKHLPDPLPWQEASHA